MNQKDYYKILGIDNSAGLDQVKKAYRKLAFQYHPDRNMGDPDALEKMKEINEAYATLSNPEKRREYDRFKDLYGSSAYDRFRQAHSYQDIFKGSDIDQIFDELARIFGFRGSDDIFRDFYGPGFRTFESQGRRFYSKGFVFTGFPGRGYTGERKQTFPYRELPATQFNGIVGKLIKFTLEKVLRIQFPEKGKDWSDRLTITPQQAEQGAEVEYPYKNWGKQKNLMVSIPAGIKRGQRIKLKGMGGAGKGGAEAGDLYLEVRIRESLHRKIWKLLTR